VGSTRTDSDIDWIRVAREFSDREIRPRAREIDRTDDFPREIRDGLARTGLMGLTIPSEFGGGAASARVIAGVLEEVSAASAAVATLLSVHLSVAAWPIVEWGTPQQRATFLNRMAAGSWLGAFALTEPGAGSDAGRLACRCRSTTDGFVLNGTKMFITNAGSADVIVLFATRDPSLGHQGIDAFLVPKGTPGLSVAQKLAKLGLRGSETTELVLEDVHLPRTARLGPEGEGFTIAMRALAGGRVGIAACALGVARAAYDEMRTAVQRDPADWKKTEVARAFTELSAARALIEKAADEKDRGEPFVDEASAAKLLAAQTAVRIASRAMTVIGPDATIAGTAAERLLRDARVFPIVEGTTEIQELILGRDLVGR
jgi:alkylation response protein AidB-like acyl-CoA dehydrogenase